MTERGFIWRAKVLTVVSSRNGTQLLTRAAGHIQSNPKAKPRFNQRTNLHNHTQTDRQTYGIHNKQHIPHNRQSQNGVRIIHHHSSLIRSTSVATLQYERVHLRELVGYLLYLYLSRHRVGRLHPPYILPHSSSLL
jgi:hypothetical protein